MMGEPLFQLALVIALVVFVWGALVFGTQDREYLDYLRRHPSPQTNEMLDSYHRQRRELIGHWTRVSILTAVIFAGVGIAAYTIYLIVMGR